MNGDSIIGLHIFESSGAIFRIPSASVGIVPPDFGSSLALIVPPVMIIATRGRDLFGSVLCSRAFIIFLLVLLTRIFASSISDSRIPML